MSTELNFILVCMSQSKSPPIFFSSSRIKRWPSFLPLSSWKTCQTGEVYGICAWSSLRSLPDFKCRLLEAIVMRSVVGVHFAVHPLVTHTQELSLNVWFSADAQWYIVIYGGGLALKYTLLLFRFWRVEYVSHRLSDYEIITYHPSDSQNTLLWHAVNLIHATAWRLRLTWLLRLDA